MEEKLKPNRLGGRFWAILIIFSFTGQIAWVVENMYFNVFMDKTVTTNPFAVELMVALSAIASTFTTLIAGNFSDRIGKRKPLISFGYIIWGLTIMVFAFLTVDNTMKTFHLGRAAAITATVAIIVIMDCIMSIFGSVSNDAAFDAWTTDNTDKTNRGTAGGVIQIIPFFAMAAIFGGLDSIASAGKWTFFFILLGGIVSGIGVLGVFLVKDRRGLAPDKTADFKKIIYGFKPEVVKQNKEFYIILAALCLLGIANQAYFPYIIQYVDRTLGFSNYIVPVAAIIGLSAIASIAMGLSMDRVGKKNFLYPLVAVYILGGILMTIFSPLVFSGETPLLLVIFGGFILMAGGIGISIILMALLMDHTPADKIGLFQGVRMVGMVLLPMVIGPLITAVVTLGAKTSVDPVTGDKIYYYPPYMFSIASAIMALNIPILIKVRSFINKKESINEIPR
jgi:Major Facilitator Superfamily.